MIRKLLMTLSAALLAFPTFYSPEVLAADRDLAQGFTSQIRKDNEGKIAAYSVLAPQKINPKTPADYKEVFIERVPQKFYQPGKIHVKTKAKFDNGKENFLQSASALTSQLQSIKAEVAKPFADFKQCETYPEMVEAGFDKLYEVNIPLDSDPLEVCAELMKNPEVEYACPIYVRYANHQPNDVSKSSQYALSDMKMYTAWDYSRGSANVKIAIVDSGTDWDHVDLAANIWNNPNEVAGNGRDDDNNGKIDDIHGWDFCGTTSAAEFNSGRYGEDNDAQNSYNTHGTSVAGCASAATNNNRGIAGIGYNCKIIPIKCGSTIQGYTGIYRGYEGITYAANLGAQVINCSWGGGGYSNAEQEIINYATAKGSLVVTSAGNDGTNNDFISQYPANYAGVLSAGSTSRNYGLSSFSNYGYSVTAFAPGSDIYTLDDGDRYTTIDGTSFSSPNISGVAGLIYSLHPDWTPAMVLHQIRSTCDRNIKPNGSLTDIVYGSVNAENALRFNDANGDNPMPGVATLGYTLDGNTQTLSGYDQVSFSAVLKNYLGAGKNFKVTAYSPDMYFDVNYTKNYGNISANSEYNISFNIQLKESCPWQNGFVRLVLRYEADGYEDYEMIAIPVNIQTNESSYTTLYNMHDGATSWNSLSLPTKTNCWALGYGGYFSGLGSLKTNNSSLSVSEISAYPGYAIGAYDNLHAFAGTSYQNQTKLILTADGGSNWASGDFSQVTNFINDIHFFDSNNGIVLGDPIGGKWGIAYTTNGGSAWTLVNTAAPITNETGTVGAFCALSNNAWFGTSAGRVLHSDDFGRSWAATSAFSGAVRNISFRSTTEGVATFASSSSTTGLATTTNGGETWNIKTTDLSLKSIYPVYVFGCKTANAYYAVQSDGAIYSTQDEGNTWKPILTKRTGNCQKAIHYDDGNGTMTVYTIGAEFGRLTFKYYPFDAKPSLAFNDGAMVKYDTVQIGKNKSKFIKVTNSGQATAAISATEIIPGENTTAEEFTILTGNVESLDPGAMNNYRVKFAPLTPGKKSAHLRLTYNGESKTVSIAFEGYAVDAPEEPDQILTIVDDTPIDFGSIEMKQKKQIAFKVENHGTKTLQITNFVVAPSVGTLDGEFSIINTLPVSIVAGKTTDITVEFAPENIGKKGAEICLTNNGDVSPICISAKGNSEDNSGVNDDKICRYTAYPNPAEDYIEISGPEGFVGGELVEIYDAAGSRIFTQKVISPSNIILLNTSNFSAGSYTAVINKNNSRESINIVIIK